MDKAAVAEAEPSGRRWPLAIAALLLTCAVGVLTMRIEHAYLHNFPHFYDAVLYSFHNARLHRRLADEGRLSLAMGEWLHNDRNPIRTVPLILFAPALLAHPLGHMATTLPALFAFLLLLGLRIRERTGSTVHGVASMGLFCSLPGLYDPTLGLATNWLDLPAALLVGAACLCLVSAGDRDGRSWFTAFAVLASLAALSRYVAGAFAFVAAAPLLAARLLEHSRHERKALPALRTLAGVAFVVCVLAVPFLLRHLESNLFYYSALAWGMSHGPAESARFLTTVLGRYVLDPSPVLRLVQCLVVACLLLLHGLIALRNAHPHRSDLLMSTWLALGVPLFMVFALQTSADPSVALYALPGIFVFLVTPLPLRPGSRLRRLLVCWSILIGALAVTVGGRAVLRHWIWATRPDKDQRFNHGWITIPSADVRDQKAFDVALAEALSRAGEGHVWAPFFDESGHIQTIEAFGRFGRLILPAGPRYFSIYEMYWKRFYPGLSERAISDRVYAAASRWIDLAVVLDEPERADTLVSRVNARVANPITRSVARDVAERIRSDPRWRRAFMVDSRHYGPVAGYRNLESGGRGYRLVLESHGTFSSAIDP